MASTKLAPFLVGRMSSLNTVRNMASSALLWAMTRQSTSGPHEPSVVMVVPMCWYSRTTSTSCVGGQCGRLLVEVHLRRSSL
eukprot:390409-Pyramimonas_sp.AAC.1